MGGKMRWEESARRSRFHANMPSGFQRVPRTFALRGPREGEEPLVGCHLCKVPVVVGDRVVWWSRTSNRVIHSTCWGSQE